MAHRQNADDHDDVAREIRAHLELEAEERVAEGLSEEEARSAARRAFGNVTRTQEDVRAVWAWRWISWGPAVARHPVTGDLLLGYGVDQGFLEMLRVEPLMGRRFLESEYRRRPAVPDVALITWGLWQSAYGGRPDIVGQTLDLSGATPQRVQIVGVLPRDFDIPSTFPLRQRAARPIFRSTSASAPS
jgi:hypothetical protein